MPIEIQSTKTIYLNGQPVHRHAEIVISDGQDSYLWRTSVPLAVDAQANLDAREAELWAAASAAGEAVTSDVQAKRDFRKLPNWADWTGQEAEDFIHNLIFSGQDEATLHAQIDSQVTNVATIKIALKQTISEIIAVRATLEKAARAIMYLRDINL